jgi:hypothetical protein
MDNDMKWRWRAPWVAVVVVAGLVGWGAYLMGLQASGTPLPVRHVWFPFGWLFWFFAIFFLVRLLGGCGRPWHRYYGHPGAWYDDPARWDEWHRRAHEHMKDGPDPRR